MARSIWQKTITDDTGNIQEGAQITVRDQQTNNIATIYTSQSGGTAKANPFLTPASGVAKFFAEPGFYKVTAFKDGQTAEFEWNNIGDNILREFIFQNVPESPAGEAFSRNVGTGAGEVPDQAALNERLGTTGNVIKSVGIPGGLSFIPDTLRKQVELSTQGKNTVLYNANGDPSIMVPIYKFRYEDLGFAGNPFGTGVATAFMVNGVEKSEVFIGAFQAHYHNGQVVSLPGLDPRTSVNFDTAKSWCQANGQGWHLMSEHEWAAIALWCMANGFEPRGNTNYGRAHDATHEIARRNDGGIAGDSSGSGAILTGSGPEAWRHDNSPFGIADLTGNIWEWSDQLKLVDGRVYCTTDNNFEEDEINWVPQGHYLSNESGNLTLKNSPGVSNKDGLSTDWGALSKEAGYSESQLLQRLLFSPAGVTPQGRLYARTGGERLPFRGGDWYGGSSAGLAARYLIYGRSGTFSNFGFRPAFVA